jgi:hypothetical protein
MELVGEQPDSGMCRGTVRVPMSITDEFWLYAKEAMISASRAETEHERQGLLDLARTWTQAALVDRHIANDHDNRAIAV